nr:MAG TPA: hypothetical protein [Caudoviricetes sp.]DAW63230.1 MAG TPA: hypothetical protein [Caudoviricetes sp.]
MIRISVSLPYSPRTPVRLVFLGIKSPTAVGQEQ